VEKVILRRKGSFSRSAIVGIGLYIWNAADAYKTANNHNYELISASKEDSLKIVFKLKGGSPSLQFAGYFDQLGTIFMKRTSKLYLSVFNLYWRVSEFENFLKN
jgi:hypothetical protein